MQKNRLSIIGLFLATSVFVSPVQAIDGLDFNFDSGNSAIDVIIPKYAVPVILSPLVSPSGSDASILLRYTTLITNAWFDAIAPYHPTAIGVYSNLGRRPESERVTNHYKNIAMFYATYRVLNSLMPSQNAKWRDMLQSVGLDPDDNSTDLSSPIGIGNVAGKSIIAVREHDGMNQLGDERGSMYSKQPYADYTGYRPKNTAYQLKYPSNWQPNVVTTGNGMFSVQQYVTPQYALVKPYSFDNPNKFHAPNPVNSNVRNLKAYKAQADEVLKASAELTDEHKMIAELFNNKINSLGFSVLFVTQSQGLSLDEFVHVDFLTNLAAFDGGIVVWNEKTKYDAVRPFSAIHHLYNKKNLTAWGGPGKGTVKNMPGAEWRSYLNTADHPEYPSGSSCFCAAQAEAMRRFTGTDTLGWVVPQLAGSSQIEPGITPKKTFNISFPTWTDFEQTCGISRVYGGVHFNSAVQASKDLCKPIGDTAYDFVKSHIDGAI